MLAITMAMIRFWIVMLTATNKYSVRTINKNLTMRDTLQLWRTDLDCVRMLRSKGRGGLTHLKTSKSPRSISIRRLLGQNRLFLKLYNSICMHKFDKQNNMQYGKVNFCFCVFQSMMALSLKGRGSKYYYSIRTDERFTDEISDVSWSLHS